MNIGAITNWKEKALSMERRFERYKEAGLKVAERGANVALSSVGAAAGAFAAVYAPTLPVVNTPTDLTVGGIIVALGVFDLLGGMADQLSSFGAGLLSVGIYRQLQPMIAQAHAS